MSDRCPLGYLFPNRPSRIFSTEKKGTETESQKISFCIGNYMHSVAPFWRLVSAMTSVTLRNAGTQAI